MGQIGEQILFGMVFLNLCLTVIALFRINTRPMQIVGSPSGVIARKVVLRKVPRA